MPAHVPDWWELLLLSLAAFRTWRLLGLDAGPFRLLERGRDWLTGDGEEYRHELDEMLRCPWCLGTYCAVAWWGAWMLFPHATLVVAGLAAVAAVVGLLGHFTAEK